MSPGSCSSISSTCLPKSAASVRKVRCRRADLLGESARRHDDVPERRRQSECLAVQRCGEVPRRADSDPEALTREARRPAWFQHPLVDDPPALRAEPDRQPARTAGSREDESRTDRRRCGRANTDVWCSRTHGGGRGVRTMPCVVMAAAGLGQLPADERKKHGERNVDEPRVEERATTLGARQPYGRGCLRGGEAVVVLVDEALALEAEEVCVRPQKPFRVRLTRKQVEALVFERLQIARTDVRLAFDFGQLEPLTRACVTKAVAELEHL